MRSKQRKLSMKIFVCLLILLKLITGNGECEKQKSTCLPALEGHQHNLTFNWSCQDNRSCTNLGLIVESHDSTIGYCNTSEFKCFTSFKRLLNISMSIDPTCGLITLKAHIFNVSRQANIVYEGDWSITRSDLTTDKFHHDPVVSCRLNLYSKASNIKCDKTVANNVAKITCAVEHIFPEGMCQVNVTESKMTSTISKGHLRYWNEDLHTTPNYYKFICIWYLPLADISYGIYQVTVYIFSNITGSPADIYYGTSNSEPITIDYPIVNLPSCPKIIEEGANATCICEKWKNDSNKNISIHWFDGTKHPVKNNISNILNFYVTRNTTEFFCVGSTSTGILNPPVYYKPYIVAKPFDLKCIDDRTYHNIVSIMCSVTRVFPKAFCQYKIYQNEEEIILKKSTSIYNDIIEVVNKTYYATKCFLNISKSDLVSGFFLIVIKMYPDLPLTELDNIISANTSITIDFTDVTTFEEWKIAVVIISAIIVLICLSVIVIHFCIKAKKKVYEHQNCNPNEENETLV